MKKNGYARRSQWHENVRAVTAAVLHSTQWSESLNINIKGGGVMSHKSLSIISTHPRQNSKTTVNASFFQLMHIQLLDILDGNCRWQFRNQYRYSSGKILKLHTEFEVLGLPEDLSLIGVEPKYESFLPFGGHFRHNHTFLQLLGNCDVCHRRSG